MFCSVYAAAASEVLPRSVQALRSAVRTWKSARMALPDASISRRPSWLLSLRRSKLAFSSSPLSLLSGCISMPFSSSTVGPSRITPLSSWSWSWVGFVAAAAAAVAALPSVGRGGFSIFFTLSFSRLTDNIKHCRQSTTRSRRSSEIFDVGAFWPTKSTSTPPWR